ncbi:hypothetical protein DH2020_025737 [Rehmannia glutinosa]|uniref:Disease resistance RPP13-like protein 1 n=1 Tax=Rehmannia glutinosa TaxID=99300 RepID=A0ABR0W386_REHGL
MAVGELFLSAFVQVLFQQLASAATMALARREKVEGHFKKLSHSLSIIQAVLDDAEEKQLTEKSVKVWLEGLRDLAYDLDDLLDEIITRALIQDSDGTQHNRTSRVWKFIPTCSSYMPGALVSNYRLMSKIKDITNRLQYTVKQRIELNLRENLGGSSNRSSVVRLPSTSLVNESQVYGRDEDKETIIEMLLGTRRFESVTKISSQSKDLDMLQVSLKEKLAKSKFLIVLDDVWNENYGKWDDLCRPFQFGLPGAELLLQLNDSVASVVGSPRTAYHMKLLTDEDCLSLLAQHARRSFHDNTELREVGLGLVKKCKGLPLAAKTLGGLLRSKETKEEWDNVLNSKIWDLQEDNDILPVLRLSYHHLPSHLKHLFSYCSIFPKDYEFDKNELVLLWMGEGFLEHPNARKRKEELGLEYFNELLSRSFFQRLSGCD